MALIEWNDSLSVGISSIDRQHAVLIKLTNQCESVSGGDDDALTLRQIIPGLTDYTVVHFTDEEG